MFVIALIVYCTVCFAHLALLLGFKKGSSMYSVAYYIICKTSLENYLCFLVSLPPALGMIARVLYGPCASDAGFWDTMICNPEAVANALPQDMVMLTYLSPVVTFVFLKGVRKETIIVLWVVASGSTLGCIVYLRAWSQIWAWIIPTVNAPVIAYEFERSKVAFFLQSRKTLQEEKEKRLRGEQERLEQERERREAEAVEEERRECRRRVLAKLPVHTAILMHSQTTVQRRRLAGGAGEERGDASTLPCASAYMGLTEYADTDGREEEEIVASVLGAIEAHRDTLAEPDFDGKSACELAQTLRVDERIQSRLLFLSLPVDVVTGEAVPADRHCYGWHRAVQHDRHAPAVGAVLDAHPLLAEALAGSEDPEGRQAINIASARCKRLILQCVYLHRRYEIKTRGRPHHESATCVVHLAADHDDGGRAVALKLREVEARREGGFSDRFVVGILRTHCGDDDPEFLAEVRRKGLGQTPYCIAMEAGARSLADIVVREHLAGDWERIRGLSAHIARAVGHMHERGFIHGDVKRETRPPLIGDAC